MSDNHQMHTNGVGPAPGIRVTVHELMSMLAVFIAAVTSILHPYKKVPAFTN